jgi:hypothetical protein
MESLLLDLGADPRYGSQNTGGNPVSFERLRDNPPNPRADIWGDHGGIFMSWGEYRNCNWRSALLPGLNGHYRDILDPEIPSGSSFTLMDTQVPIPIPSGNRKRRHEVDTDFAESSWEKGSGILH